VDSAGDDGGEDESPCARNGGDEPAGERNPHKPVNHEDAADGRDADGGMQARVGAEPLMQFTAADHHLMNLLGIEVLEVVRACVFEGHRELVGVNLHRCSPFTGLDCTRRRRNR
jgi:hypothetical protein